MAEPISSYALPPTDQVSDPIAILAGQIAEQLAEAWKVGQRTRADEFLAQHPELSDRPEAAIRVIYEEICQRQEAGETVPTVEILGRFPQWQAELAVLLDCHRLLEPQSDAPAMPKVGDVLGGFHLIAELGRGSIGRVFLATEPALGGRHVVLKATPCTNFEHLSLARLQHTHIVPLYAVHDFPERRLRVICMPYLGGTTLERLLRQIEHLPFEQRSGKVLLEALDSAQSEVLVLPIVAHLRRQLAEASYADAVCRIGACLADALAFAHDRGLIHLDLKPSNVLITPDAQPMLLDFNLAHEPLRTGAVVLDRFGGTRGYMSPEQQMAFDAVAEGTQITTPVDGRSDVYSLGLILYEALGGPSRCATGVRPRLDRCNPQVSIGLADIVHKCLATDPRRRYVRAIDLAADLRRHLQHQPLRGIYNRSLLESWRKWRLRHPHALAWGGIVIAVLAAMLSLVRVALHGSQRREMARTALLDGRHQRQQHLYGQATLTLTRGQALAEGLPGGNELMDDFAAELRLAARAQAADGLHSLADQLRFSIEPDLLPPSQLRDLEPQCGQVWEQRAMMLRSDGDNVDAKLERGIRDDLVDVAVLWTELRTRLAPADEKMSAHRSALATLQQVRDELGDSILVSRATQSHLAALGEAPASSDVPARDTLTANESYVVGRFLLQCGRPADAIALLEQAAEREPQGFWPNFYHGVCAYRLHRFADAAQSFRICLALSPDSAACWFNLGVAYIALGQEHWGHALYDLDRALTLNSSFTAAALNRGILHYRLKQPAEAIADFETALQHGADPVTVHYHLALVYWEQRRIRDALTHLQETLRQNPQHGEAKSLMERIRRQP